jgi:hypothetical protein
VEVWFLLSKQIACPASFKDKLNKKYHPVETVVKRTGADMT